MLSFAARHTSIAKLVSHFRRVRAIQNMMSAGGLASLWSFVEVRIPGHAVSAPVHLEAVGV